MKNYNANYDVVTAVEEAGQRKVTNVTGKKITISNAADDLDIQSAIAAIEGIGADSIVITACSSSGVVPN